MRVLIDLRCLQSPQPRGGVGAYAEELVRTLVGKHLGLGSSNQDIEWILFANGFVDPRRHLPRFGAPNVRWVIRRWPNKYWNARSMLHIGDARCLMPDSDIVLLPNLNFLPPIPRHTRVIVTVHDLSFEHFPDCFTWKQRLWHRAIQPQKLLARADAIIAVSETTKRDVVETYGIPERKVHVVYPGIRNQESGIRNQDLDAVRRRYRLPPRFLLSLSELAPRKNIDGLIAAYELLTQGTNDEMPDLVIAGIPGSASRAIARQIARSPVRDRIHLLGPVPEHNKRALLTIAQVFAYPSLWEGFGFPPLEAMVAGVPVVASTGGALPKVLGDAALLVDPLDPGAIADALHRVLIDEALRRDLIARGRARVARYRWDEAAMKTREVIRNIMRTMDASVH